MKDRCPVNMAVMFDYEPCGQPSVGEHQLCKLHLRHQIQFYKEEIVKMEARLAEYKEFIEKHDQ